MKYASTEDIKSLTNSKQNSVAISIFIPTHRIPLPQNIQSDKLRLKNAMQFINRSLEESDHKQLLKNVNKELQSMYDDQEFWYHRDNGLAIYIDESNMQYFDLPIETETNIYVQDSFILSPLLAANQNSYTYYVLDLNLEEPRLFHANQTAAKQILKDDMPKDIKTELNIDEYQQSLQHGTSRGGSRDAVHHGHGARDDNKKKDIMKYLRTVAKTIQDAELHDKDNPLIIAADENTKEMFMQVSKYKHILPESIDGNASTLNENELHQKSWEIMLDHISQTQDKLHNDDRSHNKIILSKIDDIVTAAKRGELTHLTLNLINATHDSVVNRFEKRFKISMPDNNELLQKVESALRSVMQKGGKVSSLINRDDNQILYGTTYAVTP